MKHKVSKQILSTLLALVMVVGLIPASTLTAFAAEATEIDEIVTIMAKDRVPKAGMEVDHFIPNVPDGVPYERDWDGAPWYDSNGVMIAPTLNHHYDIGYEFEAGRTYYADYDYTADEGYVFAQNPTITLTGPDPSMFTYEIVDRWTNNRGITVRYTFTIPGEINYPDINKVSMMYYGTAAEGYKMPEPCELIYNNCTITREEWNTGEWNSEANWGVYEEDGSNAPTFLAGERYVHMIELTAKDGYKFSAGLHVQKGRQGYEEYGVVSLSDDRTVATVKFTYDIGAYQFIDTVELVAANQHVNFMLRSGESIYLPQPFGAKYALADDCPYAPDGGSNYMWIVDETGEHLHLGYPHSFEAGKKYTLSFAVRIKDEYITTYKFAKNPTLDVSGYTYANSDIVKFKISGSGQIVNVTVTFTAQFPKGAGSSANNPAVCNSYWEFKYAMESNNIRYVALGNVEDVLPAIPHDEEQDPGGITTNAIVVRGTKDLNLMGNAVFKCPLTMNYDLKYYIQLLTLTDAANSNLYIHGPGSLTYEGGTLYFVNSVIKVDGGRLCVDGATIRGGIGYHTGYCYGINARYGNVSIQGGATVIGENYAGAGISAIAVGEEGETRSLSVSIFGGKFYVKRYTDVTNENYDHGIAVWNDCGLRIYGGSIEGIHLGRNAADTLDEYIMDGCAMTVNGVKTNPADCGSIDGKIIEVYTEISNANLALNSPVAGEAPVIYPEDVYWIPEGCTVESVIWYENGQPWNLSTGSARFEAGSSYKVDIVLVADSGVKFANPLTSATINYKTAEVSAHAGNAQTGIVMTVDFGVCPAIISDVELNVTAPKEGNTISYSVTDSSDAYGAVGSGNTITNYRAWYVSDDGSNYTRMSQGDKFVAGKYYKFSTWVRTADGYEFPLYDNGVSIVPNVSATVNGYYANVTKAYDQDPTRVIVVEYDFGMCNDSVIENITVVDVTAPVAGEYPSYTYNILGSGYQMDTSKNAYLDVYWKNPPEKWYYVKSGISWWDVTDGAYDYVYENDTFIPGHQYQCKVYLKVEDGFEFAYNNGTPTVTATMNGNAAEIKTNGSGLQWEQQVTYTFSCSQAVLSAVEVSGIDAPVAGQTPDYTGTVGNAALYGFANYGFSNVGFWWYDSNDNPLSDQDKFVAGETYRLEIKLTSAMIEQVVASRFQTPVTATLNGKTVDSSDVMANSSTVYIYQTYTCKEVSAVFVSGSVTSFNDASGDITLQLIPEGFSEPAYETIVKGNTVDYYFADVAAGTYTLKVSKANHVTREYTVVVGNSSVIQDVKIQLLGDINGDGKVNTSDVSKANSHTKKVTTLTGYEFACADITGDGKVNTSDVSKMNAHVKKTNLLW